MLGTSNTLNTILNINHISLPRLYKASLTQVKKDYKSYNFKDVTMNNQQETKVFISLKKNKLRVGSSETLRLISYL
jgi:hypothetical protein